MNNIRQSKNLYVVDDKKVIKNYIRQDADYWTNRNVVPTLEQIIDDLFDNEDFIAQDYDSSIAMKKDWLEMVSVYDFAKTIQNVVSYNLRGDINESKKMKLRIKEEYDDTTTISSGLRRKLNKIAQRYSKWLSPKELRGFYDEISELGVTVPAWSYDEDDRPHKYLLDGKEVTNSLCVFQTYEGDHGRNEYNIYFS